MKNETNTNPRNTVSISTFIPLPLLLVLGYMHGNALLVLWPGCWLSAFSIAQKLPSACRAGFTDIVILLTAVA